MKKKSLNEKNIVKLAIASRIFCIALSLVSSLIGNLDGPRNSIVFGPDVTILYRLVSPFVNWDGNHFLNIAVNGYDSVLSHAFFPGLPITMRLVSFPFSFLIEDSAIRIALCGVILNQIMFVIASVGLYRLSLHFCDASQKIAFRATLFFIFPSSNIFMSALYTETPFAMCTFWGLYYLYVKRKVFPATIFLFLASFYRSNGILSTFFILHEAFRGSFSKYIGVLSSVCIYLPYFLYSSWSRNLYCSFASVDYHSWCAAHSSIYGYIQSHFWGVSFLSYWKLANIGYFILMIPTLVVSVSAAVHFLKNQVFPPNFTKIASNPLIPFLLQMGVLTAFTLFIANCQILTRILSSCPIYFWTLEKITRNNSTAGQFLLILHLGYFLLGPLIFSNGLNWT